MNRKKIFLIVALMGLSITGITLVQIHWMLKTIRLNEENFDRAVNESLVLVVGKLEMEKDIKFSLPWTESMWFPKREENEIEEDYEASTIASYDQSKDEINHIINSKPRHIGDKRYRNFDSSYSIEKDSSFESQLYNLQLFEGVDEKKNQPHLRIEQPVIAEKPLNPHFVYKYKKDAPEPTTLTVDYSDTLERSVKIIDAGNESKFIIFSNNRIDTISANELPKSLIPPPPPPPREFEILTDDIRQIDNKIKRVVREKKHHPH